MSRVPSWFPPTGSSTSFRNARIFWWAFLVAVSYIFFFQKALWDTISIYTLMVISILALTGTAASGQQAAEAKEVANDGDG